jgi:hypothetical protein
MTDTAITQTEYTLSCGDETLTATLQGGKFAYKKNGKDILTPLSETRGDTKPAVSHACAPIWGAPAKLYGFEQHGPVRSSLWTLHTYESEKNGGTIIMSCDVQALPLYTSTIRITQTFILNASGFSLTTAYKNTGTTPVPVNHGHHLYFSTPAGWDEATLDEKPIAADIMENSGYDFSDGLHSITIPGMPPLKLKTNGYSYIWMWTGQSGEEQNYDSKYCCIEPLEVNPEGTLPLLAPGLSRSHAWFINSSSDVLTPHTSIK